MSVFDFDDYDHHEKIVFISSETIKLEAIIAIHSTALGPSMGGLRFWPYENSAAALRDVLRLSKGMSYKMAMANLPFGGGKSVVIHKPSNRKAPELLQQLGREIEQLSGDYITGEDVGSTVEDMIGIRKMTDHVMGTPLEMGGSGDPSPSTALGCFESIRACVKQVFHTDDLQGVRVAVQGLGNVGGNLCRLLAKAGAELTVADIDAARADRLASELKVRVVDVDHIYAVEADVFAPCALGSVVNDQTLPKFKVKIIAGGANNQLVTPKHGESLQERDILYAPDYVINAGGVIQFAVEHSACVNKTSYDPTVVAPKVRELYNTLVEVFDVAAQMGIPTNIAADRMAQDRINKAKRLRRHPDKREGDL
jgi:leucine dehydrogenase